MLDKNLYRKFLLTTKYLMFVVSVFYFVTLVGAFLDKDVKYLLLLIKIPAWIVMYGVLLSKTLGYCFSHRLPMYYMLSCNGIFLVRHYIGGSNGVYIAIACALFLLYLLLIPITNKRCRLC